MPVTQIEFPILSTFLCAVESMAGATFPDFSREASSTKQDDTKPLPKGVVLGPDGKPCRTCTSSASWKAMMGAASKFPPTPQQQQQQQQPQHTDCPPDVEVLGRSTWTLLHTLTASYPTHPSPTHQTQTRTFLSLFSTLYPCWHCAEDFRTWMATQGNEPRVSSREEFGQWMCEAHNAVNVKLGKREFDCGRWEERWRTGWREGGCD